MLARTEKELVDFIVRAEEVYRDIIYGGVVLGGCWDEGSDRFLRGHLEEAPDLWPVAYHGVGFYRLRFRVLPSSGYASIADLNAVLHKYWSEEFEVPTGNPWAENNFFVAIDGMLYYTPPEICFGSPYIIFETAQFKTLEQSDERTIVRAELYIIAVGTLYRGALQWEIAGGRIVARDLDWGYVVE